MALALLPGWSRAASGGPFDWYASYENYERNHFAIELALTSTNFEALKKHLNSYQYLLLYLPEQQSSRATAQLRIGFFASRQETREFIKATSYFMAGQKVVEVAPSEHQQVLAALRQDEQAANNLWLFAIDNRADKGVVGNQKQLLDQAKENYLSRRYDLAARQYLLLAALADETTANWAKELAALSYEKLGERQQALALYEELLEAYPAGNSRQRIEQRQRSLATAADDNPAPLRSHSGRGRSPFYSRGVFGQYYRTMERSQSDAPDQEVLSLLSTDWDWRATWHTQGHELSTRISGYHLSDQLEDGDNELVLKRLQLNYHHTASGLAAALGRQREINTGVFTAFDGVQISYPITDQWRVAASTGTPVYRSDALEELDHYFYSVNSEYEFNKQWQINGYFITQTVNSVTDREAVGLSGRFHNPRLSAAVNLDYDTAFAELNNLLVVGNAHVTKRLQLAMTYGQQRSPFLTASNILIGQADLDLESYLSNKENRANLLDDALLRTSNNQYFSLSVTTEVNDQARWVIDLYDSTLTDVPSAELLLGLPETGNSPDSYHYQSVGSRLVFNNFLWLNDSTTLGLKHTQGETSNTTQLIFNERLRLGSQWVVIPKLLYSEISFDANDDTQKLLRYSLNVTYRPWRRLEMNLEMGNEAIHTSESNFNYGSNYIFVGYRFIL